MVSFGCLLDFHSLVGLSVLVPLCLLVVDFLLVIVSQGLQSGARNFCSRVGGL